MQRFMIPVVTMIAGLAAGTIVDPIARSLGDPAMDSVSQSQGKTATRGGYEFDDGSFSHQDLSATHPTAFAWVRPDGNGDTLETWLLFRPTETDGWAFPGASNTSISLDIEYEGSIAHTSVANFVTWALGQLPAELEATSDDF